LTISIAKLKRLTDEWTYKVTHLLSLLSIMPRHNCVRNRLCACTKNSFPIPWHPPEALTSFIRCLDTWWKKLKHKKDAERTAP